MKTYLTLELNEHQAEVQVCYTKGCRGDRETPPELPEIEFLSVKINGTEVVNELTDEAWENLYTQALAEIE